MKEDEPERRHHQAGAAEHEQGDKTAQRFPERMVMAAGENHCFTVAPAKVFRINCANRFTTIVTQKSTRPISNSACR